MNETIKKVIEDNKEFVESKNMRSLLQINIQIKN